MKLGLTFPADVTVLREEIFAQVRRENEAAAEAVIGSDALAALAALDPSAEP